MLCKHNIEVYILLHNTTTIVACPPVRLVGGVNNFEGRVEVYYQNQWGTVCDDFWGLPDANVVCRQLGFGSATAALSFAAFGQGSGTIWLDNLRCSGSENCLGNCTNNGWGVHNCVHFEDAGVRCSGMCVCVCVCMCVFAYSCIPVAHHVYI